jgi:hypothetical protein
MTITYRAAYIAAPQDSTSGGWVLTLPKHASLSDADLMAEALKGLAEYNESARAVDAAEASESDIIIGDWTS